MHLFKSRKVLRLAIGCVLAISLSVCSDGDPIGPQGELLVTQSVFDLLVGDIDTVAALGVGGTTADVEWTSGAPNVVTISKDGVLTAVGVGSTTVTAVAKQNRSQAASAAVRVQQKYFPRAGTYDLTFTFDSTRFEVTAPNGGCPTSQGYCTYTRPTGTKSTLSGTMKVPDSTFSFTPTFPSGPSRLVSIAEVMMSGRFCSGPDFATPVGCTLFEDVPMSRHTALLNRVPSIESTSDFVRIDSGLVSSDFPTERFLSLTYNTTADSVYGRFLWILHKSVRSPTAQLGSFVAKRRKL